MANTDPVFAALQNLGSSVNPYAASARGAGFTGFVPENHQGETPTVTHPKYAVYDYLNRNNVDPASMWAEQAANDLNKQFDTQQFRALDGQTLGYGDEYVHSAPSGYGTQGYHDTGGPMTDFFWGATGDGSTAGGPAAPVSDPNSQWNAPPPSPTDATDLGPTGVPAPTNTPLIQGAGSLIDPYQHLISQINRTLNPASQ